MNTNTNKNTLNEDNIKSHFHTMYKLVSNGEYEIVAKMAQNLTQLLETSSYNDLPRTRAIYYTTILKLLSHDIHTQDFISAYQRFSTMAHIWKW